MRKLFFAALTYTVLGLLAGIYYRELTKAYDFTGDTQLSTLHTHLLALGMLAFLIVLALEKVFTLSASRWFRYFFWFYNAGLLITVALMTVHGTLTVVGSTSGAAIAGIAGLGHIVITVGIAFLFACLYARLRHAGSDTGAKKN
ncbi:DUF2871 domain-containing protein [Sciscionella sediminilitoris]|uniref:DUF2871 domain-containing protein n=1 Tax=Sciscionella sediminilitoris TaxID=1445613 RepID=UPI0004DF4035|nr:DUF2871 domain-containing protein [Sciscionella sp. SE31]